MNYTAEVPFYDLWHEDGHVPEIRRLLPPLLKDVRRGVLEIGAGTGLITQLIGWECPGEIYAVEPSLGMRSVLLNRLAESPGLLARVTVLPYSALDVDLDEPVEAVVMISVLYGLPPEDRELLWPTLARQLEPDGLLIFNYRERPQPEPGELELMGSYQVGRHAYEVWGQVLSSAPERSTSRYLYRVRQRGVVISEDEVLNEVYRPTRSELGQELGAAGFVLEEAPEGMLAWRLAK